MRTSCTWAPTGPSSNFTLRFTSLHFTHFHFHFHFHLHFHAHSHAIRTPLAPREAIPAIPAMQATRTQATLVPVLNFSLHPLRTLEGLTEPCVGIQSIKPPLLPTWSFLLTLLCYLHPHTYLHLLPPYRTSSHTYTHLPLRHSDQLSPRRACSMLFARLSTRSRSTRLDPLPSSNSNAAASNRRDRVHLLTPQPGTIAYHACSLPFLRD